MRSNINDCLSQEHEKKVQSNQAATLRRVLRADSADPRSVLGLPPRSELDVKEITKLFRQQSLLVHPDKNPASEAEEAFKKLKLAYEELDKPSSNFAASAPHIPSSRDRSNECLNDEPPHGCRL